MAILRVSELEQIERYKTLIGCVVPRPIAWVTTLNDTGSVNLAPFSAFNMVCSTPMTVLFSIGVKPNGETKDTLTNILRTEEFVINIPRARHVAQVAHTAASYAYNISESDKAEVALVPSVAVATPRVAEALFSFECTLQQTVQVGDGTPGSATVVFGAVSVVHVADEVYAGGRFDFNKVDALARLGGYCYSTIGDVLEERVPQV